MKSLGVAIVAAVLAAAHTLALADTANWNFIQSVGGLSLKQPAKTPAGWLLPVQADVSGLNKVTVQPTLLNSGVACANTRANVEGSVIILSVITSVAGGGSSSQCPPAKLGSIAPGTYAVRYRGGDKSDIALGEIVIAP